MFDGNYSAGYPHSELAVHIDGFIAAVAHTAVVGASKVGPLFYVIVRKYTSFRGELHCSLLS